LSTEAISNNLACSCDQVTDEQQELKVLQRKKWGFDLQKPWGFFYLIQHWLVVDLPL
jgi:hypothetical protein